jgi:hypothetical protein
MEKYIYSIVETDNFGGDYPDESFVIRGLRNSTANTIADLINKDKCPNGNGSRYWKVVKDSSDRPYELQPGFEA